MLQEDLTRYRRFAEKRTLPETQEAIDHGWLYLDTQTDPDGPVYVLGWGKDMEPWGQVPGLPLGGLGFLAPDGTVRFVGPRGGALR